MSKLSDYLNEQIERRGWSKRELARRAGISSAQVTDVLNERANPGFDYCAKVAGALGLPPEKLLRMAGILPALPPAASEEEEALYLFRQIGSHEHREAALRMLSSLSEHSYMIPEAQPNNASRMGLDPALQELIRRIFRLMWEIAPSDERAAMFVEFVGELSRETEHSPIESG